MSLDAHGLTGQRRARGWFAFQLLIAWLPVVALYATTMVAAHGVPLWSAILVAIRTIGGAALLGLLVVRLTERVPWPRPVKIPFVFLHVVAALVYSVSWIVLSSLIESIVRVRLLIVAPVGLMAFLALGVWLYVAVAGVSYAVRATERAARAEAASAKAQLAALRGQLNPHFLFNALHTVVQLIPEDPARAAQSAELLAALLRTVLEEDRDLVSLAEERAFVERYLELERLRFGERLIVSFDVPAAAAEALVPAFVLQTLVENAVRHGAASRIEPTRITISGHESATTLHLTVHDDGVGADLSGPPAAGGTGLRRLRERLDALYGLRAKITLESRTGAGFTVHVALPLELGADTA